MVLEEAPGKVSEALRLFLQGMGYGKHTDDISASMALKMVITSSEVK